MQRRGSWGKEKTVQRRVRYASECDAASIPQACNARASPEGSFSRPKAIALPPHPQRVPEHAHA
eukprot:334106-Pyramimonas_sp.AAC.1